MKKAVIYTRHILTRKKEDDIQTQINICKEYAEKNNIEIVDIYSDLSAEKLKVYPEFKKLRKKRKALKGHKILISSMTILGRHLDKIMKFEGYCKKKGVKVVFIDCENNPAYKFLRLLVKGFKI